MAPARKFAGKKAAPFAAGGKRKSSSTRTAKGVPKKTAAKRPKSKNAPRPKTTQKTGPALKFGSPEWRAKYNKKRK